MYIKLNMYNLMVTKPQPVAMLACTRITYKVKVVKKYQLCLHKQNYYNYL